MFCVGFASPQGSALASLGVFASPWVANPPQGAAANADNNNIVEITKGRKVYFWDTGIRNAVIGNFAPVSLRQDVGALWENYLVSERRKALAYAQSPARCYFWRTTTQSEIDYIEELDGRFAAFEFKWNVRRSPRMPAPFASAYPESSWTVVTHDDYQSFLTL